MRNHAGKQGAHRHNHRNNTAMKYLPPHLSMRALARESPINVPQAISDDPCTGSAIRAQWNSGNASESIKNPNYSWEIDFEGRAAHAAACGRGNWKNGQAEPPTLPE
jgi:hypothetical protein